MNRETPKRIHIIGSVGSGKTTLAKELSLMLSIPFFELDNVVWMRQESGDIRRNEEERKEYLNTIIQLEHWIIEGVHTDDWVTESFQHADLILLLDTKYSIRIYRIIKRFMLQKFGLEKSNYKPTIEIFFKMFKWNSHFEEVGKSHFYTKFGMFSEKILVVANKRSIVNYFNC